ncbi:MAG: hypothetical protein C5B57_08485 [Blastocatellia bacterium]|nr:MAG: hypothetical protein C5B57_08485 [Blastocatellia bacterium]
MVASTIAVVGCNNANRTTNSDRTEPAATGANHEQRPAGKRDQTPITVTGCLQKGGFNTYILTRTNTPRPESVGTGRDDGANDSVAERDQIQAAQNAYRIDPSGDVKLDELVGKQITVKGMIAERADLQGTDQNARATGTAGNRSDASDRQEIKAGDLAKIDATSVTKLSDQCGGPGATRQRRSTHQEGKN